MKAQVDKKKIDKEIKAIYTWLTKHRDFMEEQMRIFDRQIIEKSSLDPNFNEDLEYDLQCKWIEDEFEKRYEKLRRIQKLYKLKKCLI